MPWSKYKQDSKNVQLKIILFSNQDLKNPLTTMVCKLREKKYKLEEITLGIILFPKTLQLNNYFIWN